MHDFEFKLFRSFIAENVEQFDGLRSEVKQISVNVDEFIDSLAKITPNSEENPNIQELRQYASKLISACNNSINQLENMEHQEVASTHTPPLWY